MLWDIWIYCQCWFSMILFITNMSKFFRKAVWKQWLNQPRVFCYEWLLVDIMSNWMFWPTALTFSHSSIHLYESTALHGSTASCLQVSSAATGCLQGSQLSQHCFKHLCFLGQISFIHFFLHIWRTCFQWGVALVQEHSWPHGSRVPHISSFPIFFLQHKHKTLIQI